MNGQGLHGDGFAGRHSANRVRAGGRHAAHLRVAQPAKPVRTRNDLERAILGIIVIQMKAEAEQGLEQGDRRLDMALPVLDRPVSEAGDLRPLPHGDDAILMPGQMPVGLRRLVEASTRTGLAVCPASRVANRVRSPSASMSLRTVADGENGRAPTRMPAASNSRASEFSGT